MYITGNMKQILIRINELCLKSSLKNGTDFLIFLVEIHRVGGMESVYKSIYRLITVLPE